MNIRVTISLRNACGKPYTDLTETNIQNIFKDIISNTDCIFLAMQTSSFLVSANIIILLSIAPNVINTDVPQL